MKRIALFIGVTILASEVVEAGAGADREVKAAQATIVKTLKEVARKELFHQCEKARNRAQQLDCQSLYAALYIPK